MEGSCLRQIYYLQSMQYQIIYLVPMFGPGILETKSYIPDTLNLSMCADSSNNTNKSKKYIFFKCSGVTCQVLHVRCHMSGVTCKMSHVTFHVSPVICHISLTSAAADPPSAKSSTIHSRMMLLILT